VPSHTLSEKYEFYKFCLMITTWVDTGCST